MKISYQKLKPKLWTYWEDPIDGSSKKSGYIDMCFETMKFHCSDSFDIHILNRDNAVDFIKVDPVFHEFKWPVARSCYIRILLLAKYGGIWLDADTLIVKPLDPFIKIVSKHGVFWGSEKSGGRGCQYDGVMGASSKNEVIRKAAKIVRSRTKGANAAEDWRTMGIGPGLTQQLKDYKHYELPNQNFYSIGNRNASDHWLSQNDPNEYLKDEVYGFSIWNRHMRRNSSDFTTMDKKELLNKSILFSSIYKKCME